MKFFIHIRSLIILLCVLFAITALYIVLRRPPVTPPTIVAEKFDQLAVDGCAGFVLSTGERIVYSCGWTAARFKGKVLGNPQVGDRVEFSAEKQGEQYFLYDASSYIKKL
jgi:hypothetical protein